MPMARTRRGRLRQIEHWLNDKFPPSRPTYVKVCDLGVRRAEPGGGYGDTYRRAGNIYVRVHSKLTWYTAIYVLFHEWAHAVEWPLARAEKAANDHNEKFGIVYARILHEFFDNEGWKDSRHYPED